MNILIIEDEKKVRETIVEMVKLYAPQPAKIAEADSVSTGLEMIAKTDPDLLLLDINLKDGLGFDILNKIGNHSFNIVFITAYQEYALRACKISALDYLLKPIDPDELAKALEKAYHKMEREKIHERLDTFMEYMAKKETRKITLKTSDSIHIIHIDDIIFCQADGNYTTFNLIDKRKIIVSKPLGDYEDMINQPHFIRTHQSYLVNMNHVIRYDKADGGILVTHGDEQIPVSSRKKELVLQYLQHM